MTENYQIFKVCALLFCFSIAIQNCDNKSSMGVEESLSAIPDLVLIEEAINSAVTVNSGSDSYFSLELHDISPNNIISEGKGNGWCIAWNKPIASDNTTHQGLNLYSTHGSEKWKPINYLLNTKSNLKQQYPDLTYREIQVAIWYLLDFPAFDLGQISIDDLPSRMVRNGKYNFDVQKVTQIVQHVNQDYQSFQYNSASTFAVVVETPSDTQTVIIEVDESVWAYGQHSFRSQELRDRLGITTAGRGQWGWIYEMETDYETTELIAGGGDDDGTKAADEVGTIIGSLEMMKGNDWLEITFSTFSGYLINNLHLWVGCSLDDFPVVGQTGNVAPGQLPYSYDDDPTDSHTFRISLSELNCGGNHFIAAHAGELFQVKEIDVDPELVPVFTMTDLSQYGLTTAVDINDHSDILSNSIYWNNSLAVIIDIPLSGAIKMNNNRQIISSNYYWDSEVGVIEIDTLENSDFTYDERITHLSKSYAYDINDHGYVVGELDEYWLHHLNDDPDDIYFTNDFYWMTWHKDSGLEPSYEALSTAYAINNLGDVTGVSSQSDYLGIFVTFGEIGPYEGYDWGIPSAINNKRQIVGSIAKLEKSNNKTPAFKSSLNLTADINDINKFFRITNSKGVFAFGGVIDMLRNSTFDTEIEKIRGYDKGFDIKHMYNENFLHLLSQEKQFKIIQDALNMEYREEAFIWDEENGIKSLGTLGGDWSTAFDINDHGQVVGYSRIGDGGHRAFYWDKQNGMLELPTYGGNSIARAINNHGQIVGESYDDNGNFIPVMWEVSFEPKGSVLSSRGY